MEQIENEYQDNRLKHNHINNYIKVYGLNTPIKGEINRLDLKNKNKT